MKHSLDTVVGNSSGKSRPNALGHKFATRWFVQHGAQPIHGLGHGLPKDRVHGIFASKQAANLFKLNNDRTLCMCSFKDKVG